MYNQVGQVQCGDTPTGSTSNDGVNLYGNAAREVVYRILLATQTTLTVTTCGSNYDTWLRYAILLSHVVTLHFKMTATILVACIIISASVNWDTNSAQHQLEHASSTALTQHHTWLITSV